MEHAKKTPCTNNLVNIYYGDCFMLIIKDDVIERKTQFFLKSISHVLFSLILEKRKVKSSFI